MTTATEDLVKPSINERPYSAQSNHTVAFARLVNQYAEIYDAHDRLMREATRYRDDADRSEKKARELALQLKDLREAIAAAMKEAS